MTALEAAVIIPGVIAGFVGASELRASRARDAGKIKALVAVALAMGLVLVFLSLDRLIDTRWSYMHWLAHIMTALAIIVSLSGLLTRYSSRLSAILMAVAGFILIIYWGFWSLPIP
jgi:cytochrome bd-type quinol oxidase subunit 2